MLTADDCPANREVDFPDDRTLSSIPYTPDYGGPEQRCHDCGIKAGGYHHPGCDMEICPRCLGQLISCGCLDDEDYEDDEDLDCDPD